MAEIQIREDSRRYRDSAVAVHDLSLDIADGEFVLVGELAEATASEDSEARLGMPHSAFVARVGVATSRAESEPGRLWIDARRLHLFDPANGQRLSG